MIEKRLKSVKWEVLFLENESIVELIDPTTWHSQFYLQMIDIIDRDVCKKVLESIRSGVGIHVIRVSNSIWNAPNKAWQKAK